MQYHEITFTAYLIKDVHFQSVGEMLARNINKAMLADRELAEKHAANQFKHYVFSGFYPVEAEKIYKAGRVYVFRIRSLDTSFASKIRKLLPSAAEDFKVLASEEKIQKYRFITELITITPALATVEGKHWIKGGDFMLLQERMHVNLIKKYKTFFGEELQGGRNFIQMVDMLNDKPLAFNYKGIKLFGNKFRIIVNEDEESQKLAFTAMATGLLEKNSSCGMGFCMAK